MLDAIRTVAHGHGMCTHQFARLVTEQVVKRGMVDLVLSPPSRPPVWVTCRGADSGYPNRRRPERASRITHAATSEMITPAPMAMVPLG
jgi:hypothetical protein